MQIYFSCSITGGRQDQPIYQRMVAHLQARGHQVPTALLADAQMEPPETQSDADYIFQRDVNWVKTSQALIAEVSTPSHGVGYEIALAESLGLPVLCCYQAGRKVSKMITGNPNPAVMVRAYRTPEEALEIMDAFLKKIS